MMYEQKIIENLREFSAKYQYEDQKLSETCFRAADAIEGLLAVIQRQKEMINATAYLPLYPKPMKWIPVSERLPDTDKCVLVISYGRVCYARLLKSGNNGSHPEFILQDGLSDMLRQPVIETTAHNKFTRNRITHWMLLPEPPKEEKNVLL